MTAQSNYLRGTLLDITDHYSYALNSQQLLKLVNENYPNGVSIYQLSPIDQLHTGGIKASERLLQHIKSHQSTRVLDVGSGTGGLMRLLQSRTDCEVIGLDITHAFNQLNKQLHQHCSESKDNAALITADAQRLPFTDNCFDLIICQHSLLNVPSITAALAEFRRILNCNGLLLLHELLQGPDYERLIYPVPWARRPEHCQLATLSDVESVLDSQKFNVQQFTDLSEQTIDWRARQIEKEYQAQRTSPRLDPSLIFGNDFQQMGQNLHHNLKSQAVIAVELLAQPNP